MGRSGGSSSDGGSSGGRSGGDGYSSGGRSHYSGGRSSSSSGDSSGSGGYWGSSGSGYYGGSSYGSRNNDGWSLSSFIVLGVVLFLVWMMFFYDYDKITLSSFQRMPLEASLSKETAWYQDNNRGSAQWIGDREVLETGMKYFFQKTGVRPFLLINTIDQSITVIYMTEEERLFYTKEQYNKLFNDEAHALFIISDNGRGDWRYDDYIGSQAKTVLDKEAINIIYDYFDKYWNMEDIEEEELFSKSFSNAADRIMTITKKPVSPLVVLIILGGAILVIYLILYFIRKFKEQKIKELELTKVILETPIEDIKDNTNILD